MSLDPIDVLLEASQAHAAELKKRSGVDAAILLVLLAVLKELKLSPASAERIEKLKTSFLYSKLQDDEVEAANRTLQLLLQDADSLTK